jgi:putative hydrolase of the HAD superfamily
MTTKGIIFDLFHTLTGRETESSSLPFTSEVLGIDRRRWDELLLQHSRWRLAGEVRDPYTILATLARLADPGVPDATIREALRVRVQRFRDALVRIPQENLATLRELRRRGLRIGLVSNADALEVAAWSDSPVSSLIDVAIFSCEVGSVKPEPEIYERCLRDLALDPADCLFVGDGGSDELVGARHVGLRTVFVSGVMSELWPHLVPQRLACCDHHVERLPEVLALINSPAAPA